MPLQTRKPTGKVAFPFVLVDGEDKSGKSYVSLQLSRSPRVNRTFAFDLGDSVADEYAALGRFEVVDLTGTYRNMVNQLELAMEEPAGKDGQPNVITFDSATIFWNSEKDRASTRARSSQRNRKILAEDPDADIETTMNYWNEAKERWAYVMNKLRIWPGIAVVTAQGGWVTKVDSEGRPTKQVEWSTQAEKNIGQLVTAMVRLERDPRKATLVGVRSLTVDLPRGGLTLPLEDTLDHLVFDIMAAGGGAAAFAQPTAPVLSSTAFPVPEAKRRLIEAISGKAGGTLTDQEATAEAVQVWTSHDWPGGTAPGKDDEITVDQMADLLSEIPDEAPAAPAQQPQEAQEEAPAAEPAPEAPEAQEGTQEPESGEAAPAPPEEITDSVGKAWPADEWVTRVIAMNKPTLVRELAHLKAPTNGTAKVLTDRLLAATGFGE